MNLLYLMRWASILPGDSVSKSKRDQSDAHMQERNPRGRNRRRTLGALEIYPERCRKAPAQPETVLPPRSRPRRPAHRGPRDLPCARAADLGGARNRRRLSRPVRSVLTRLPQARGLLLSRSPPAARTASASRRRPRGRRCHSGRHAAAAAPGGGERGPARSSGSAAPAARALPRCFGAALQPLPPGQRGRGEAPGVGAAGLSYPGSRAGLPGSTA
ncbi:uncharacterized protein [Physeter macrocephalus]|uniref:Translation initiation factor IF-2-like n=1 Tax=Physeter macrocephalus TaxID=9755 RepID=A0A9W2WRI4_PHYMC|nr:uncharacterized protein LOC129392223 [Physeter catodon]